MNVILQSLAASFDSWTCIIPHDLSSTHFLKYLVSMMKLMKFRSSKVDPAHFVDKLGALISRARGVKFVMNRANDVPEVLGYILCEMLAKCPVSIKYIFSTSFKVSRSAMFAFHPLAQKSRSLCLEYLSEALFSFPFKIFSR